MERERLQKIYNKTDGNCHLCHGKLSFKNYAIPGAKGAWEVEHSKARSNGGSSHLNNLFPAHIDCNRGKGVLQTKTVRAYNGQSRAPYSKKRKNAIRNSNTTAGAIIGGVIGSFLGPEGTIIGASIGAAIGRSSSPKK